MKIVLTTKHGFSKTINQPDISPDGISQSYLYPIWLESSSIAIRFKLRHVCSYSNTYYYEEDNQIMRRYSNVS